MCSRIRKFGVDAANWTLTAVATGHLGDDAGHGIDIFWTEWLLDEEGPMRRQRGGQLDRSNRLERRRVGIDANIDIVADGLPDGRETSGRAPQRRSPRHSLECWG